MTTALSPTTLPPRHTSPPPPQSPLRRSRRQTPLRRIRLLTLLVLDCFIDRQDETCSLYCSLDGIDLDQTRFPDKGLKIIPDAFVVEVDAGPDVAFAVLDAQAVEDVGGIEAGVVAQLAGDDLEGFGEGFDDGLLFVRHVFVGVAVQEGGDFHL